MLAQVEQVCYLLWKRHTWDFVSSWRWILQVELHVSAQIEEQVCHLLQKRHTLDFVDSWVSFTVLTPAIITFHVNYIPFCHLTKMLNMQASYSHFWHKYQQDCLTRRYLLWYHFWWCRSGHPWSFPGLQDWQKHWQWSHT